MEVRIKDFRLLSGTRPVRAGFDIEVAGIIIREFRLIMNGRLVIEPPSLSWRDQETGDLRYRPLVTISPELRQIIEGLAICKYRTELEAINARAARQPE